VPGGRDIRVYPLKYRERLRARIAPDRIRTRHMTAQGSEWCRFGVDFEWNVIRIETVRRYGDECPKRMSADELVQHINASLFEMFWRVHEKSSHSSRVRVLMKSLSRVSLRSTPG